VTTTEITHATPAGFAACVPSREMPQTIASQYLDQRVEVLLGGGRQFFDPALRTNGQDYFQPFTSAGYSLLKSTADLNSASTGKSWLGLFAKSHMPYVIDLKNNSSTAQKTPSLGLMTRRALENLVNANHFILQVEGGRVDHAAHTCDIPTAIRELIAFDEALDVCLEFQKKNPETLIVLTSDHATGNPGLMGQGYEYEDSTKAFGRIAGVRCSFPEIIKAIGKKRTAEEVAKVISEQTGCKVSVDKAALFIPFLDKQGKTVFGDLNGATTQLGQLMANYLGVSWCGSAHVTDYTPVTAVGPGSERFRGFIAHPDIFHNYTTLAGIDFCNPTWKASIEPLRQSVYEDVAEYALIDDDSAFEQV
jgi:alkaline phosphatase